MAAVSFLSFTGTGRGVLILLLSFWAFTLICVQTYDFLKCRSHLSALESIMDKLDEKYLFAECIPKPQSLYERRLFALVKQSGRSMIQAVSDAHASSRDYREYVESFVHETKAPLTAARLISRQTGPETGRKLTEELSCIEAHVERALYYARAESPERDCIIRRTDLSEVVSQAVGNHRTLLLQNQIGIEIGNLDFTVYTDKKWAVFILGQLLQNASRYRKLPSPPPVSAAHAEQPDTPPPVIRLSARPLGRQVQLVVSDNGIGIPSHELSRVFDRGFTGSNGRLRGGSTGMGLYLCRRLADLLEMDIQISSEEQKGTAVTLTFPARQETEATETLQDCKTNPY